MTQRKVILVYPMHDSEREYHWFPFSVIELAECAAAAGYEPVIVDQRVEADWQERLVQALTDETVCVGISVMVGEQIRAALDAAQRVRDCRPDVPLVWGGPHPSSEPEQTLRHHLVDVVARGPAEDSFVALLSALGQERSLEEIPGISWKQGGTIHHNHPAKRPDIDRGSPARYDRVDVPRYINPKTMIAGAISSRGCSHRCAFCAISDQFRGWKPRRLDLVMDDLEYLVGRYRFARVSFHDGNFCVDQGRMVAFCRALMDRKLGIQGWHANARADQLARYAPETVALMRESGCELICLGVESGSPRILEMLNKGVTPAHAIQAVRRLKQHKIHGFLSLIFGCPGETLEDLEETVSHVYRLQEMYDGVAPVLHYYRPYPGTRLYKDACARGWTPPQSLEAWAEWTWDSSAARRNGFPWLDPDYVPIMFERVAEAFPVGGLVQQVLDRRLSGRADRG